MNDLLACGYGNMFDALLWGLALFSALAIGGMFLSIKVIGFMIDSVFG